VRPLEEQVLVGGVQPNEQCLRRHAGLLLIAWARRLAGLASEEDARGTAQDYGVTAVRAKSKAALRRTTGDELKGLPELS
jgi:hypothetical protein